MTLPATARAPSRQRLPLVVPLLNLGTFLMITTEYIVAGLLQEITADLHVSIAQVGLLITAFAPMKEHRHRPDAALLICLAFAAHCRQARPFIQPIQPTVHLAHHERVGNRTVSVTEDSDCRSHRSDRGTRATPVF